MTWNESGYIAGEVIAVNNSEITVQTDDGEEVTLKLRWKKMTDREDVVQAIAACFDQQGMTPNMDRMRAESVLQALEKAGFRVKHELERKNGNT